MIFSIVSRYIFKRFLNSLFIISPIVILMVWLTISIRYINLIVSENISIISFIKLILCVFPDIVNIILPICCLISLIVALSKMQNDKELLVFMSSGKSLFSLFSIILSFCTCVSLVILYSQTSLSPYSYKNFVNIQEKIRAQISMSIIKPGVFNVLGNSVIYIGSKTDTSISDVFISYIPKDSNIITKDSNIVKKSKKKSSVITSKKGSYITDKNKLYIKLEKGYRQELDENNSIVSILKFDSFSYDITKYLKRYSNKIEKPHEKTQKELLEIAYSTNDKKIKNKYIAEYHGRILIPFLPIINSIIISIFMLNVNEMKRRKSKGGIKSFFCGVISQILLMTLINASSKNNDLILFNYILVFFSIFILIFILFRGKNA